MKKYSLVVVLFWSVFTYAAEKDSLGINPYQNYFRSLEYFEECDACGCSASGGSLGFSSMLNTNFVGIRYFNQRYKSNDGLFSDSPWYEENFNTIQVWGRIPIVKKVQVSVLVPYHFHNRETVTGAQDISGLGDLTVLGMYTVYETVKDSAVFSHSVQLGAGVKAPTGKYREFSNGSVNPSFQVGTGSWDYIFAAEYVVKKGSLGLNTMGSYTVKTENEKYYRFGNQFNYSSTVFYFLNSDKYVFVPQLGVAGEVYGNNYQYKQLLRNTAGDILFGKAGIEIGRDKFSFGANVMVPINQNLTGGRVEAQYRWSVNLNYTL
ncbi:transporter [Flavobacterium supellecticarium]|uniref:Transporter n=1 Tax=Flavobacterium supellecticarium TaxID=2565924 RepID=A0A4S3ZZM9_9FLAO|nr:transporter [Flavobacterium supellecticarium]THF51302.1 transporter [Flavobacterium supellecticarium]